MPKPNRTPQPSTPITVVTGEQFDVSSVTYDDSSKTIAVTKSDNSVLNIPITKWVGAINPEYVVSVLKDNKNQYHPIERYETP